MVPAPTPLAAGRGGPTAAGCGGPTAGYQLPLPWQRYQDGAELCLLCVLSGCWLTSRSLVFAQGPLGGRGPHGIFLSWSLSFRGGVGVVTVSEEEGLSDGTLLNELKIREMTT